MLFNSPTLQFQFLYRRFLMKIYTKTGDKGMTSLWNKQGNPCRLHKSNPLFEAIGDNDELTSHIGVAISLLPIELSLAKQLRTIQTRLQNVNSILVNHSSIRELAKSIDLVELETWIDEMDEKLPQLTSFILPGGGSTASAHLHVARAVCRRAERHLHMLYKIESTDEISRVGMQDFSNYEPPHEIRQYLNR